MKTNPPRTMDLSRAIPQAEQQIQLLRREFERFLSGALDLPPKELEVRIEKQIRRLHSAAKTSAERFQINAVEAKFNSYRELYGRKLRNHEEGRDHLRHRQAEPAPPDARQGVRIDSTVSEREALALYQHLYGHRKAPAVGLPQFRRYLDQQVENIRQRTGCRAVVFRLDEDGDALRLKARPVRDE